MARGVAGGQIVSRRPETRQRSRQGGGSRLLAQSGAATPQLLRRTESQDFGSQTNGAARTDPPYPPPPAPVFEDDGDRRFTPPHEQPCSGTRAGTRTGAQRLLPGGSCPNDATGRELLLHFFKRSRALGPVQCVEVEEVADSSAPAARSPRALACNTWCYENYGNLWSSGGYSSCSFDGHGTWSFSRHRGLLIPKA